MTQGAIKKQLGEFFQYLKTVKKRSSPTIDHYRFYLGRFLNWAKIDDAQKISAPKIKAFKLWLGKQKNLAKKNLKSSTQNYYLIALRSFLKYLKQHGKDTLEPITIKLAKTNRQAPEIIGVVAIEKILNAPQNSDKPDLIKLRDRALLELLFSSGIAVSEIASLNKKAVDFKKQEIIIKKSNLKSRQLKFSSQTTFWLKKYLEQRPDNSQYVFASHDRALNNRDTMPLTVRSVQRIVKFYAQKAGITQKITPHKFRYYYAENLRKQGDEVKEICQKLGHNCLATTRNYFSNNN